MSRKLNLDMYGKVKRGLELPQSKLNETIVKRCREEHAEKERQKRELDAKHGAAALAKRYGVSESAMEKVLSYQSWRHVL